MEKPSRHAVQLLRKVQHNLIKGNKQIQSGCLNFFVQPQFLFWGRSDIWGVAIGSWVRRGPNIIMVDICSSKQKCFDCDIEFGLPAVPVSFLEETVFILIRISISHVISYMLHNMMNVQVRAKCSLNVESAVALFAASQ